MSAPPSPDVSPTAPGTSQHNHPEADPLTSVHAPAGLSSSDLDLPAENTTTTSLASPTTEESTTDTPTTRSLHPDEPAYATSPALDSSNTSIATAPLIEASSSTAPLSQSINLNITDPGSPAIADVEDVHWPLSPLDATVNSNSIYLVPDLVPGSDAPSPADPATPAPASPVPTHFSDIPAVRDQTRSNMELPLRPSPATSTVHVQNPPQFAGRMHISSLGQVINNDPSTPEPTRHPVRALQSPDLVLPRWQPDAEATYCPICQSQFSIFVRKHHCRKCGRVVCNSCSPHQIVIPYQYIVRPPGQPGPSSWNDYDSSPTVSGGERVRLCNPCVPDPNTAPPIPPPQSPQYTPLTHQRSHSGAGGSGNRYFSSGSAAIEGTRSRSATVHTPRSGASGTPRPHGQYGSSSYHPSSNVMSASERYHDLIQNNGGGSSSSSHYHQRSLPPSPPLAEEDECPVCHLELPSRSLTNFEALRETHIAQCITSHSAYRGVPAPSGGNGGQSAGGPSTVRRTGMFPYVATEKDCVDSAECTICLEEFEAGEQMARLECLCRFHLRCIRAWFRKNPGRCPVHQHDSFGY